MRGAPLLEYSLPVSCVTVKSVWFRRCWIFLVINVRERTERLVGIRCCISRTDIVNCIRCLHDVIINYLNVFLATYFRCLNY